MRRIDLTGQKFGKLTVLGLSDRQNASGARLWKCRCACGNITYAASNKLLAGKKLSCGCYAEGKRPPPGTKYLPKTDCVSYREGMKKGCTALTERLCVTRGQCKFYRSRFEV